MPRPRTATRSPQQSISPERHAQRFQELKRSLDQLEYFCKGTVLKRMMKCGKAQCACASDPARRHGPYFELTYKVNGKPSIEARRKRLHCIDPPRSSIES